MSTNTYKAAQKYSELGFSVIPLKEKNKNPALDSWIPYQTQHATPEDLKKWFSGAQNIGIVTGKISGAVVLDIDGPDGDEALEKMLEKVGALPDTLTASTGKGRHIYFRHPGIEIRNSQSKQLGIDFRGDGGFVVAPPSVHPSGAVYAWTHKKGTALADPPAWLVEWMTAQKTPEWIKDVLIELGRIEKKTSKTEKKIEHQNIFPSENLSSKAEIILQKCGFCRHCKDNAKSLSEPEWYAMLTNISRADGGRDLVHELSRPHPGYSKEETDRKMDHALNDGEPHSCEYISEKIAVGICPDGGCGVKAPIAFVTSEIESARTKIVALESKEKILNTDVFSPEILGALAIIKKKDQTEYTITKSRLKTVCKELNLHDLDRSVKDQQIKLQELRLVQRMDESAKETQELTIELGFTVHTPHGWLIRKSGIYSTDGDKEVRIMPIPFFLTRRIVNADTGEEKVEITFVRDGGSRRISASRNVTFNRSQLVSLANHSLPVTSENAREVIQYLSEFEASNLDTIPKSLAVTRMGWIKERAFLPGCAGDIELDIEPGMAPIASGYTPTGEFSDWAECMREVRRHKLPRLMMAASFAAPMLRLVGHRVFLLHIWGPSRGGKTAALKAALSVWGDPDAIMASFNTTKVGLERLAAFYSDLPLGIDERQIAGGKQDFIENLVYLIGMGKGKTRGAKGGGLQAAQNWRTIALTTGEEPLSSESSNTGIRTRAVEVYGVPFSDEALAGKVHAVTRDHHGGAGPRFVQFLINEYEKDRDSFKTAHQQISDVLAKKYPRHMGATISQLAMLAVGDIAASTSLFGVDFVLATEQGMKLVEDIARQLDTDAEADEANRAMIMFKSWCQSNLNTFDEKYHNKSGFIHGAVFYIYTHKFETIMQELGFNSQRMLKDWSKLGYIKTQMEGDRVRTRIRKYDKGSNTMGNFIAFTGIKEFISEDDKKSGDDWG